MKLTKSLLLGGLLMGASSAFAAKSHVILTTPEEYQIMHISPNGKWACGVYSDYSYTMYGFRWNLESGKIDLLSTVDPSEAWAIADDGTICGTFSTDQLTSNHNKVAVPGYNKKGVWTAVEMPEGVSPNGSGSGISPDGHAMTGYVVVNDIYKAFIWRDGKLEYSIPSKSHAIPYAIAPDGKSATGWMQLYNRAATLWKQDGTYEKLSDQESPWSAGRCYSSDGKTLLFWGGWDSSRNDHNYLLCLYDMETGEKSYIPTVYPESGLDLFSISDNGIVVGTEADDRYAFVYADGKPLLAVNYLKDKGVDLSELDVLTLEGDSIPMVFRAQGISADGKTMGLIYYNNDGGMQSAVVILDKDMSHCPPTDVAARALDRVDVVRLTWVPMPGAEGISGYNVYRDGVKLNSTPIEGTVYYDEGVKPGLYQYVVAAVFTDGTEVKAEGVDMEMKDIAMQKPLALFARQKGVNSTLVQWQQPLSNYIVLSYADNDNANLEGFGISLDGIRFESAIRVDKADMKYYGKDAELTQVTFFPMSEQKEWKLNVYTRDEQGALKLLHTQAVTQKLQLKERNTIVLTEPLVLPEGELIVSVECMVEQASESVIGMDYGRVNAGYADLVRLPGEDEDFYSLYDATTASGYPLFTTWMIDAIIKPIGLTEENDIDHVKNYVVSCDGKQVATVEGDCLQTVVPSLTDGAHVIGVKAVYANNSESDVAEITADIKGNYLPVSQIKVDVDGQVATVNWETPVDEDVTEIGYSTGVARTDAYNGVKGPQDNNYGLMAGVIFPYTRFQGYEGYLFDSFNFYPTTDAVFTFMLLKDGQMIAEVEADDYQLNRWNYVKLDTPISIDKNSDYMLVLDCYDVEPAQAPLAIDKATAISGQTDLYSLDGESWSSIIDANITGNWLLSFTVKNQEAEPVTVSGYDVRIDNDKKNAETITDNRFVYTATDNFVGRHEVNVDVIYPTREESVKTEPVVIEVFDTGISGASADVVKLIYAGNTLSAEGGQVKDITLYAIDGRTVRSAAGNQLSLGSIQSGIYLVTVKQADGQELTKKIEIRR